MAAPVSKFRRLVHRAIAGAERDIDSTRALFAGAAADERVRVLSYAGYRNAAELRASGRIVRWGESLDAGAGFASRFRAMVAIYDSDELAGVPLRIEFEGRIAETVSDAEGYFHFALPLDACPLPPTTIWEQATLSTPDHRAQDGVLSAPILAPGADGKLGIISDIDDTIVETGATDFIRNWRRVLLERPEDRIVVPGAASLYRMIAGGHDAPSRPFFYVSSSPWNLYGFLARFMELNDIPHGPMFLKDYGLDAEKLIATGHDTHKLEAIERILAFYPEHRFLLIGDNGQKDVEIYSKVVEDYGDRVAALFIRDVSWSCRTGAKGALLAGVEAAGVPVYCGEGFGDAVAVVEKLGLAEPVEAAKAVVEKA